MSVLDRNGILARKPRTESVVLGDSAVLVRGMSGTDRDSFEASLVVGDGKDAKRDLANLRARVCVRCIVGEDGGRLFDDDEAPELGTIAGDTLDAIYEVAARLSGIGKGDVEAAAKN